MVTSALMRSRRRVFLKEHRETLGVSAEEMARRLGIERESVYRLEREAHTRLSVSKQIAYAEALGIDPTALWRLPGVQSLDEMLDQASEDVRALAADIVRRLLSKN